MDPGLVIVVATLVVGSFLIGVPLVRSRRLRARLEGSRRIEAPIVSQARVAVIVVAMVFAVPGIAVGGGLALGLDGLVVVVGILVLSAVGIGVAMSARWTHIGAVILDDATLEVRHPDPGHATTLSLDAPFELEEGWGERVGQIMIHVAVHQARRRPVYFHYVRRIRGAIDLGEQPPTPVRGFALGTEGEVIHRRLRERAEALRSGAA